MTFGELLKIEITRQGYSQKQVALEVGITETALSQIVNDVYYPQKKNMDKILEFLQVELVFSFERINNER